MTELAVRRFIGHTLVAGIDLRELPHQRRVVQRLFHRRVGETEPLLQKVDPQHALDADRTASIAGLGVVRLNCAYRPSIALRRLLQRGPSTCCLSFQDKYILDSRH